MIQGLLALHPTVIRGNASEILALSGMGKGGKGVDSTDSSDAALEASVKLAREYNTIVCVTGTEMMDMLSGYLSVLWEQDAESLGGGMPNDDFYYGA